MLTIQYFFLDLGVQLFSSEQLFNKCTSSDAILQILQGEPIFGSTKIVDAVDEFTARVLEEMDFKREAENYLLTCITTSEESRRMFKLLFQNLYRIYPLAG